MKLDLYQIDAFASKCFEGNPAAICPLEEWLTDDVLQSIAAENNLSETAFFVPNGEGFDLRWFTPTNEVKLCGHATLATAFTLFELLDYQSEKIEFSTKSGILTVSRDGEYLEMNFPAQVPVACDTPGQVSAAFAAEPSQCLKNEDLIVVFDSEDLVRNADPEMSLLEDVDCRGIVITSQAKDYDFIARFFAPRFGIPEDPVTGSAFTQLVPYWAQRLDKTSFRARQVSARGGDVRCELQGDRVVIAGKAVKFLQGWFEI